MKKFLFGLLPFLLMAVCAVSFTACSSDDDDEGGPADAASAIAGEYEGNVSLTGYTGSIPTVITLDKRNSELVDMKMDCAEIDLHYDFNAISVEENEGGSYTIRNSGNTVFGTVTGSNLTVNLSSSSGSILFTGVKR